MKFFQRVNHRLNRWRRYAPQSWEQAVTFVRIVARVPGFGLVENVSALTLTGNGGYTVPVVSGAGWCNGKCIFTVNGTNATTNFNERFYRVLLGP